MLTLQLIASWLLALFAYKTFNRAGQCYFMKESLHISQSCVTERLSHRSTFWYHMIDHQPELYALLKVTTKYWENKKKFSSLFRWRTRPGDYNIVMKRYALEMNKLL